MSSVAPPIHQRRSPPTDSGRHRSNQLCTLGDNCNDMLSSTRSRQRRIVTYDLIVLGEDQAGRAPPVLDDRTRCIYITLVEYIRFVWDEAKSQGNKRKHGVSFEEARTVFFDENARLSHDPDHSKDEDRFLLLGMSRKPRLLLVCHCYREEELLIRIISARKATKAESRQYGG